MSSATVAIAPRRSASRSSRTSTPSSTTRPCLRVVEARDQRGERRLARAGAADQGDRGARRDCEVELAQHGAVGVVAERHAFEAQLAAAGRQLARAWRIGDVGGLVEHLEDALARGDGALVLADPHADHAQRPDQQREVEVVGDEAAERELAVDHEQAAGEDDHGEGELGQEVEQRAVARLDARGVELALEDALGALGEARALGVLLREGLDDAHADDRLLGLGRDVGDALLDVAQHRVRAAGVAGRHDRDRRQQDERDQRELPARDQEQRRTRRSATPRTA